jgi:hypothetical protein
MESRKEVHNLLSSINTSVVQSGSKKRITRNKNKNFGQETKTDVRIIFSGTQEVWIQTGLK